MAEGFTPIYRFEESSHIRGVSATYRTRLSRARRGTRDRSVACLGETFFGKIQTVRTCPRSRGQVRRRPAPCLSPITVSQHCKTSERIGVGG